MMWPPFASVGDRPNTSDLSALTAWYAAARPLLYQYAGLVYEILRARSYQVYVDYDLARDNPYYALGWAISGRAVRSGITAGFLMQELTPVYLTPEEFAGRVEMTWQQESARASYVMEQQTAPAPYVPAAPAPVRQVSSVPSPPQASSAAPELTWLRRGRMVPRVPAMAVSDALEVLFR